MLQYLAAAMVSFFAQSSQPSYEERWPNVDVAMANMYAGKYNPSDYMVEHFMEKTDPRFSAVFRPACDLSVLNAGSDCYSDLKPFVKITYKGKNGQYWGLAYLLPGSNNNNPVDKVMIVSDGYDPGDQDHVGNRHNADNLKLRHDNLLGVGAGGPRVKGYDVVLVDYSQGGGDIFINSGIYARLIQEISQSSIDPLVIGGPSMGGLIARVASLYLLPQNNVEGRDYSENVLGYLSIDSPHQGAQINSWIQAGTYHAKDSWLVKRAGNDIPNVNWNKLTTPAAWQMLYLHYSPQNNNALSSTVHDRFYSDIVRLGGYNKSFPMAAVAYSNFYNPTYAQLSCNRSDNAALIPGSVSGTYRAWTSCEDNLQDLQPGSALGYIADYSNSPQNAIADYMFPVCYDMPTGAAAAVETCPSSWWTGRMRPWTGTFIPISSALDMVYASNYQGNLVRILKNLKTADGGLTVDEIRAMTPFGYVGYMRNKLATYNGVEYPKYMHVKFELGLIDEVQKSLDYIETYRAARKSALLKSRAKRSATSIKSILFD